MQIPPRENIQKIFDIYENKCAFHDCQKIIIDSDNHVNGNIFFIESNNKKHPRYNPELTNEQMIDYINLIMFCDIHGWDVEWKKEEYTASGLQLKLLDDMKKFSGNGFELSDKMYEIFLHHFIDYHDPDRFSEVEIISAFDEDGATDRLLFNMLIRNNAVIKPTKHFVGGMFRIIDYKRRIRENDMVLFYPKGSTNISGVNAEVKFISKMRLEGRVPSLKEGEYFVALLSSYKEKSKFGDDLSFTVLENS